MPEVLTYPLGPLPWSLATAEGAPTKTATSALLHTLEEKAQPFEDVPASAVWILDGVARLHSMKDVPRTFSCLASYVFQLVKSAASQDRTRTDLIMDQYPDPCLAKTSACRLHVSLSCICPDRLSTTWLVSLVFSFRMVSKW